MRFIFVMDTLDRVNPDKDSTFTFIEAAQRLGHESLFTEISELAVKRGRASARTRKVKIGDQHPRIWLEGETYLVEDLGSVNGTVINDSVRLAPRQPRVLDSGDKLRVGETTLHFLVG